MPKAEEVLKKPIDSINFAEGISFFEMLKVRLKVPVYFHPRKDEKAVGPILSRDDLGTLVDGARDMRKETLRDILGEETITPQNVARFLDGILSPEKYPSLVSFRTKARKQPNGDFVLDSKGKPVFDAIFEKNSITPRPGMEADAKRVLDEIARQRAGILDPIIAGKIAPDLLAKWAADMTMIAQMMSPEIVGREIFRRAIVNAYLGIAWQVEQYKRAEAKTGVGANAFLGSVKPLGEETDDKGQKVFPGSKVEAYIPSGKAAMIQSAAVELKRLVGKGGSEYYSVLQIG